MQRRYITYTTARPPSLLQKAVALVVTAGMLVAALMFSAVLIPIVLLVGASVMGYLWWKTREVRRQMKQMQEAMQEFKTRTESMQGEEFRGEVYEGEIIEGEATRVDDPGEKR